MSIKSILEDVKQRFEDSQGELEAAQERFGGVYIARIEESDGVDLEVEVDEGHIAFTIRCELGEFQDGTTPEDAYNVVKDYLEENDISVFEDYKDWEEALESA